MGRFTQRVLSWSRVALGVSRVVLRVCQVVLLGVSLVGGIRVPSKGPMVSRQEPRVRQP